ncbi:Protein of unknown function [Pyronema omphalodes CBS 100304]|uniref:Uncharacterized protein n=1 Tax=Pyronema omphalodes (strain CBS 100304) TaxID=1076935 RepID=U4L9P6_PYROM|nr:Protein of unknown function [Pyronema omphalodes CBS 100304]
MSVLIDLFGYIMMWPYISCALLMQPKRGIPGSNDIHIIPKPKLRTRPASNTSIPAPLLLPATTNVHDAFASLRQRYPRTGPHKLPFNTLNLVMISSIQLPVEFYFLQTLRMGIGLSKCHLPPEASLNMSPRFPSREIL